MSLAEYRRKRDFHKTPEPRARAGKKRRRTLRFTVQKHDASRLHYDFRLELDGALKSWAVPKGPSLDPADRQLAVQVEDHPLAYADFEGVIPKGEYGGGTVLLWDRGVWRPRGDPARSLRAGKLNFTLDGDKLHGGWTLVRMSGDAGENGRNWLLIKEQDDAARPRAQYNILEQEPLSVLSEQDLQDIAVRAEAVWSAHKSGAAARRKSRPAEDLSVDINAAGLSGALRAPLPQTFKPQLATLASQVPQGNDWLHEMKFDGYRMLAFLNEGHARLVTRNGNDWTRKFPELRSAVERLPVEQAVFDGEVVALRNDGIPDFQRLQNALKGGSEKALVYYVFDLPYCNGYDLSPARLIERKTLLQPILLARNSDNAGVVRYSDHVQGRGNEVVALACRNRMEGIISKKCGGEYEHRRSRSWLKIKCQLRQEFVIGGATRPRGVRKEFGSLLLGYFQDGQLIYAGKVGTGFTDASLKEAARQLSRHSAETSPFAELPRDVLRQTIRWTEPALVAEVEFTEWTSDGLLRHPSFKGFRSDKPARQIVRESEPSSPPPGEASDRAATPGTRASRPQRRKAGSSAVVAGVAISNADRVIDPESGLTKLALAEFYEAIADWILPHVADRPLSLVRCPQGNSGSCFFQKHFTGSLPESLRTIAVAEKGKAGEYLLVRDAAGLAALVQWGVLEIHPWGARADNVERPDRMVFDLDPGPGVDWPDVIEAAREVRARLDDRGLESFLRTSGGKGLHVVVPLTRRRSWDETKEFARRVAREMTADRPDRYTDTMSKSRRQGRIFVDYLRNGRGATAIASYSTRARKGTPVATPLRWEELRAALRPDQYRVENLPCRLASLQADPWEGFFETRQSLTAAMLRGTAAARDPE